MASAAKGTVIGLPSMSDTQRSGKDLAPHPEVTIKSYMNQGLPPLARSHSNPLIQDRNTKILPKSYYEAMQEFTDRANQYAENAQQPGSHKRCAGKVAELSDISDGGLNGESLAMRGFLIYEGEPDTIKTLVSLTGGLHGSEARIAIKTQCDLIQRLSEGEQQLPANTAILFIPAVNPWGASYSDRCNQNNVDPNRNFPTSKSAYELHPSGDLERVWEEMNTFMNPPEEQSPITFYLKLIGKFIKYSLLKHGVFKHFFGEENPMPAAIAGGQNRDPQKLFYGGDHPETNTQAVIKMFNESLALFPNVKTVFHNDDHTGLAKKGAHSVEVKASSPALEERVADAISNRLSGCTIPLHILVYLNTDSGLLEHPRHLTYWRA
ncbi:hypothetical protein GCM10023116_24960 [Kistimonas scapharcae]|uniref:Peptidase M14 carboxypeptidase A domain-containing protein n=1 Tax=Kistimonas scapharcae TaxID=1036133 RepID=A0ABP8V432_9GAMM